MKKSFTLMSLITVIAVLSFLIVSVTPVKASPAMTEEKAMHPRIVKAIDALEDAVAYMKAAPHDFGGHRAKAIEDSEKAIKQLREALKYREMRDRK
ncbi:MAG: hypothetical protein ABSD50_15835 [Smithella sp.]|jgi:hypothetical protein